MLSETLAENPNGLTDLYLSDPGRDTSEMTGELAAWRLGLGMLSTAKLDCRGPYRV